MDNKNEKRYLNDRIYEEELFQLYTSEDYAVSEDDINKNANSEKFGALKKVLEKMDDIIFRVYHGSAISFSDNKINFFYINYKYALKNLVNKHEISPEISSCCHKVLMTCIDEYNSVVEKIQSARTIRGKRAIYMEHAGPSLLKSYQILLYDTIKKRTIDAFYGKR